MKKLDSGPALSCFALLFLTLFMLSIAQDTKEALKERMKGRFAALMDLKAGGKIGENPKGFLEPVNGTYARDTAVAGLVAAENADRSLLFGIIAKESSTSAEEVGKANAKRIFQKAQGTDYFRAADGSWKQKKDMMVP